MKKVIATAAILGVIGFAGIKVASAHSGYSSNYDYCGSYGTYDKAYTEKDTEAIEKFRTATNSIRKEIVVKRIHPFPEPGIS